LLSNLLNIRSDEAGVPFSACLKKSLSATLLLSLLLFKITACPSLSANANMFDINRVQYEANQLEFYELVIFLEDEKEKYIQFIMTGEL